MSAGLIARQLRARARLVFLIDWTLILGAFVFSFLVRFVSEDKIAGDLLRDRILVIGVLSAVILGWKRLWVIQPKYMGVFDIRSIGSVALALGFFARLNEQRLRNLEWFEGWSMPLLFMFMTLTFLGGWRLLRRIEQNRVSAKDMQGVPARRILIVGANDAGESVFRELVRQVRAVSVVGYVDEDPTLTGSTVHGLKVYGTVEEIPAIVAEAEVTEILIALPDLGPAELRRIFDICSKTRARVKLVPSFSSLVSGKPDLSTIRNIDPNDLLRRDQIGVIQEDGLSFLAGERVMITGGGGSIGSEVARQVASFSPASLILLGKGEGSIFEIEQELKHRTPVRPAAVIADVRDPISIGNAIKKYNPGVIFHAAAHKHVPLMEDSPIEAIRNNVFGTLNVLNKAVEAHVKKFILVSTDKAVKPANVMGATKRVAEMIVCARSRVSDVEFAVVRFGNVLGSRGSLVPLICKQIAGGGPVTITHAEMTRYFMTIPEAAQLILQAGSMGRNGEIFVLDMGEPVKIADLIKDIIRMHGLVPEQDIEIKTVGMRPGEKMHEELYFANEKVTASRHPKIWVADQGVEIPWNWLEDQLGQLDEICIAGNPEQARAFLLELAWAKNLPPAPMRTMNA
jgi:FlaA1/EpsC-like NDP-sugar epimerase